MFQFADQRNKDTHPTETAADLLSFFGFKDFSFLYDKQDLRTAHLELCAVPWIKIHWFDSTSMFGQIGGSEAIWNFSTNIFFKLSDNCKVLSRV